MHADHSVIEIVAHVMIAFLFLYRGLTALPRYAEHAARFRALKVPFPDVVLSGGFVVMLAGGAMVALDYHAAVGAIGLVVFTAMANVMYHHFWTMEDPQRRQTHTWIFCNNVAVMGGLLMVVA